MKMMKRPMKKKKGADVARFLREGEEDVIYIYPLGKITFIYPTVYS